MKINCTALCKVNIEIMMTGGLTSLETLYEEHPKKLDSESGHLWVFHWDCYHFWILCAQKIPGEWHCILL